MIRNTFCHIKGITEDTERLIWKNNINSWQDFIDNAENINFLSKTQISNILKELENSKNFLDDKDINYFKNKLNSKLHYRLANFGNICFLDIETTGLSRYCDEITLIGIYNGKESKIFINGIDIENAISEIDKYDIIVTFNGKTFDIPFIEYKFGCKFDNKIHLDLRFLLKELGYYGGLKKIEQDLGVKRSQEVVGVDGFEAVRLWKRYLKGDETALAKLLKYNQEDIENLKYLLEFYVKEKINNNYE